MVKPESFSQASFAENPTPAKSESQPDNQEAFLRRIAGNTELKVEKLSPETCLRIESDFQESETIKEYLAKDTNIDHLREVAGWLENELGGSKVADGKKAEVVETAKKLLNEVVFSCHKYTENVRVYERTKDRTRLMDNRERAEALAKRGFARRAAHDATIDICRAYNRYLSHTLHDQYELDVPENFLIPKEMMRDRITLRKWAQDTDYYLTVQKIIEEMKKRDQTKGPTPPEEQIAH